MGYVKLHDWRQDAVPIWVSIDMISALQLMPATKERPMLTVVRIGNGSYSEWVRETPEEILGAFASYYGYESLDRVVIRAVALPTPTEAAGAVEASS